jgi:FtsZ-interacting cell division protein ZipA
MPELRWILIAAGILILLWVYFWGRRVGPRAEEKETILHSRAEPLISAPESDPTTPDPYVNEPYVIDPDLPSRAATSTWTHTQRSTEPDVTEPVGVVRREPVFEPEPAAADVDDEPTIRSAEPQPEVSSAAVQSEPLAQPHRPDGQAAKLARTQTPRKILVLRLAVGPSRVPGDKLRAALTAQGLTFGKYDIFHLVNANGDTLFSVASMVEPGSFDLAHMDSTPYPGVTLFAQLPSSIPGTEVLDELLRHAQLLQGAIGGTLQDERGGLLNSARIQRLRQEVIDFEHLCRTSGAELADARAS